MNLFTTLRVVLKVRERCTTVVQQFTTMQVVLKD
jgi:hypothetical protein